MIEEDIITKIFIDCDDFYKIFEEKYRKHLIEDKKDGKTKRNRTTNLTISEMMAIEIYYQKSGYKCFKYFYEKCEKELKIYFPKLISYKRFVNLKVRILPYLIAFMHYFRRGENTGIAFIDSTTIKVCDNKRIYSNKVFQGLAKLGKSSMGWFYGFKLHLVVNDKGEILGFSFTPGNVSDINENTILNITKNITGKLFGDRGYISQKLFKTLYSKGLQLITRIRKNMKNRLMPLIDKILLRKRAIIETINDELKNIYDLEHTRHRSPINAMVNWLGALIAYSYRKNKPSLHIKDEFDQLFIAAA